MKPVSRPGRRDIWFRARGLDALDARFARPSALATIDRRLADGRPVRVLEIGCGEAHALMALAWRYRDRPVSLVGLNDCPTETMAGPDDLRDACVDFDICSLEQTSSLRLPTLTFADAGERLPFADGAFDLVVSGMTFPCIADKARALAEVWRVLDQDGTALVHLDSFHPEMPDFMNTAADPHLFTPRFVIYDAQRNRLPTVGYLASVAARGFDIRVESSPAQPTHTIVRFNRRTSERVDLGLTLDEMSTLPKMEELFLSRKTITLGLLWGTRSVYRAQDAG